MLRTNVPRAVRFLRRRRGFRQADVAERAGVSRYQVGRLERGSLAGLSIAAIERIAGALDATVHLELRWRGEQLDRLMDAAHAELQQQVAALLAAAGWLVRVEVSFNRYGDRGRCDILAFHPLTRVLLVVEIKSRLGDLQETLGRLDVKVRIGASLAREMGWQQPVTVVPALVLAQDRTSRRVVDRHAALFARFAVRGWRARAWLRRPDPEATGLLWWERVTDGHSMPTTRRQRVRAVSGGHQE